MIKKFTDFKKWIVGHKKTSVVLALVIIFLGYKIYQNYTSTAGEPKYILTTVEKGSVITTITGTGQVSANNQVDIQSQASGNITAVYVKPGQVVKAGALLAQVDTRDAILNLQTAQIAYQKLVAPAKVEDVKSAKDSVLTSYNNGWNAISSTFVDYPSLATGMNDLFYTSTGYLNDSLNINRSVIARLNSQKAGASYDKAKNQYQVVLAEYNSLSRNSNNTNIDMLMADTQTMVSLMADALKNTQSAVSSIIKETSDTSTNATTAAANVNSWLATINSHVSGLLTASSNMTSSQNTLTNLVQGADSLDVQAQQISLQKQELTYQNYFIRAPFDGTIAKVSASVGNPAGAVATIVSNQKIAEISLNEVDVSKIKLGNKVNLNFDAITNLNITGEVAEIDLVGTVSQGVVNYSVKINFDTQDDRVKSGMSVNASIITDSKQDVLIVPSAAVKTQNGISYVNYFDQKYPDVQARAGIITTILPLSKEVQVGLSDDTNTEIISGLNEGDQVVSRTVNTTTTTSAPSILNAATGNKTSGSNAARRIGG
jgi:HlyD family secretion protein